jgi:hypothetical protein
MGTLYPAGGVSHEPILFRVKATDPATLATPILIPAAVAAFAAFAPAPRAVDRSCAGAPHGIARSRKTDATE